MPNPTTSYSGFYQGPIASAERIVHHSKAIHEAAEFVSNHALSTARIIIGAEELLRQRIRSALRVAVAAMFFTISGIVSLGADVAIAVAKKVSPSTRSSDGQSLRARSVKYHPARLHNPRRAKLRKSHLRSNAHIAWNSLRGVASWYGNEFQTRQTASGVRFDTHTMMAAHRTLPFGTKVRVTNLCNDKSCVVEITDRGPFSKGRIIDLSFAAAEEIGMTETGVANVKLEILGNRLTEPRSFEDLSQLNKGPVLDRIQRASSRPLASLLNTPVAASYDDGR